MGDPMRGILSMLREHRGHQSAVRTRQPEQAQHRARPVHPRGPRHRRRARRRGRRVRDERSAGGAGPRRPGLRDRFGAQSPRLVYAHITGYGLAGDERDRAAFDVGAFWSRAGVAAALVPEGTPLPYQRGGMGDHMAGLAAAGAVSAALFARERTGVGQLVSVSLLRVGMYMVGWDINMAVRLGMPTVPMTISAPPNPMISAYTAGDGLRFWLLGLQGDRLWPDLLRAIDRTEWATDERYSTLISRFENSAELVRELGAVFSTRTLEEWAEVFDREDVWWAPVRYPHEVVDDPQARAAGGFVTVPMDGEDEIEMVASPIDFHGTPWVPAGQLPSSLSTPRRCCWSSDTAGIESSSSKSLERFPRSDHHEAGRWTQ